MGPHIPPSKRQALLRIFIHSILFSLWGLSIVGFMQIWSLPTILGIVLCGLYAAWIKWLPSLKWIIWICVSTCIAMIAVLLSLQPKNNRAWQPTVDKLATFQVEGNKLTVKNMRNFDWHSHQSYTANWETRTFDFNKVERVELIVVPFGIPKLTAHTMLNFHFEGGEELIVSIEARQEVGEQYGFVSGFFRQFEIIYVFGDPDDLLVTRAVHRNNTLYAFPVKATQEFIQALLLKLAQSANQLQQNPQFYSVLTRNCTTSLIQHINEVHHKPIGFRLETLFPALTGKLLYTLGYMETDLDFKEALSTYRIDQKIRNRERESDSEYQ